MSWSASCLLPWNELDVERVRIAIETALADCAKTSPEYASSRIEVDGKYIHVFFPAQLVERRGREVQPPSGPAPDGTYPCTFDHYLIAPDPKTYFDGECGVSLSSNTSANGQAWMTATKVLDRVTELLGGTSRDF